VQKQEARPRDTQAVILAPRRPAKGARVSSLFKEW
jgi:hypothetical protein